MTLKFNPPPGWPPPPAGWVPPEGWQPDPSWPVPPAGWPLWIYDSNPPQDAHPEVHGAGAVADPPEWGGQALGVGLTALAAPTGQAAAGQVAPPPSAGGGRRRRRLAPWLIAGAAVTVLLLAAVVAVVVVNRGPSAPQGLAAAAVNGSSVRISWTPLGDGPPIDSYVVARDGVEIGSVPGSVSAYTDADGLSPANTYTYSVVAVSESRRSSPTPELSVTPMAPRPSAVAAVKHTTTSIVLAWQAPVDSPSPDQYVIFRNGDQIATIAGSEPAFADRKLIPATTYQYTIAATWGSRTSEASVAISMRTNTPSLSEARLAGSWPIRVKMTRSGGSWPKVGKKWDVEWEFTPKCDSGPCTITASAQIHDYDPPFKLTLTRKGAGYSGSIKMRYANCESTMIKNTITIRLEVSKAGLVDSEWVATGIKGTLKVLSPYTDPPGIYYCPRQTHAMTVTGSPS